MSASHKLRRVVCCSRRSNRRGAINWIAWLVAAGFGLLLVALMLPAVNRGREPARRSKCRQNLKQISLALYAYTAEFGAFPPACTVDEDGHRLHSWRTLILPFLGHESLYNSIDLSKPWDDPVNARALESMPEEFLCPSDVGSKNHTPYLANSAEGGLLRPQVPRQPIEINDGLQNTLMIIEVPSDRAVPWMSPRDADESLILSIGPESKIRHAGGTHAVLCDGRILFLSNQLPSETRQALISIDAGDIPGEF